MAQPLTDQYHRIIDYLRLSVTDRCNLQCVYCMPEGGEVLTGHRKLLTYEEIIRIVSIAARLGVTKIRITGGEPLLRRNLCRLISSIRKTEGVEDISLTTNGILLEKYAEDLATAGLNRVNVSVDSLDPATYSRITRSGNLDVVLRGIDAARRAGLEPIKVNMVPVRGINDHEVVDFARMTLSSEMHVRFIEFMPSASVDFWSPEKYITTDEIMNTVENNLGRLAPVKLRKHGPSKYFRLENAPGVIGFISALTHHFCEDCNRIRITADGKIRPCLFSETEIDMRSVMRQGADDGEIERLMKLSVAVKPQGHLLGNGDQEEARKQALSHCRRTSLRRPMSKIGG